MTVTATATSSATEAERGEHGDSERSDGGPASTVAKSSRGPALEQGMVAGVQLAAGVGNLAFAVLAARALSGAAFANLAAFLALYMAVHVPAAALAAARAGGPIPSRRRQRRLRRLAVTIGVAGALLTLLVAGPLGAVTGLGAALVVMLAGAIAAAPSLGLARGRAYAAGDVRAVGASLAAEPLARLVVGLPLGLAFGAGGAAVGAVLGGWIAFAAARPFDDRPATRSHDAAAPAAAASARRPATAGTAATAGVFVLLAVLQLQDLVIANRVLSSVEASRFAVLSTMGGAVGFATATIPLVLLPRARRGEGGAFGAAVGLAAALGAVATAAVVALPAAAFAIVFGDRYTAVDGLAPRYVLAMAALGVARVIAAQRCASGLANVVVGLVAAAAGAQLVLVAAVASTAAGAANATLAVSSCLAVVLAVSRPAAVARVRSARRPLVALGACTALAFGLRLATNRGLWVDEAISVQLATRPFGEMLHQLRSVDVHPPLHAIILWLTARAIGTSELAMRLPSVIFGTALVPVVFGATRALYDRRTAAVGAVLTAVAPLLVWYSQEARMYSMFMVLAVGSVWAQVMAVRTGRRGAWVAFAITSVAMLWTQYFTVLVVACQHAAMVAVVARAWRAGELRRALELAKGWLVTLGLTALLLLPLLPFVTDQVTAYSARRASTVVPATAGAAASGGADEAVSIYAVLANGVWAMFGFHADDVMAKVVALWPVLMLLVLAALGRRRQRATTYVLALAVVPAAVLFVVGMKKRDLFELRYFAAMAPMLVIVAARTIATVARARVAMVAMTLAAASVLGVGLVDQQFNGANPRRYDFKGALQEIERRARPGDGLVYAPQYLGSVVDYYGGAVPAHAIANRSRPSPRGGVFVLATFRTASERAIAAQVGDELARLDASHDLVRRFDRANVRVWEYR